MPIYEYQCKSCEHEFEALSLGKRDPDCPSCGSKELERLLSLPTVHSSSTRALSLKAAKKRDKKQGTERMIEQQKYEQAHND